MSLVDTYYINCMRVIASRAECHHLLIVLMTACR